MNGICFIALLDSPWMVAIILLIGAIANWLSNRRQKQAEAKEQQSRKDAGEQPDFDLEETLRKLLGEDQKRPAGPPPVPRTAQSQPPPVKAWIDDDDAESEGAWLEPAREVRVEPVRVPQTAPLEWGPLKPPGVASSEAAIHAAVASVTPQTVPVVPGQSALKRKSASRKRAAYWRNPKNARHAFVASVVFAQPKGLEA
ncbi:MAG TPA: hypothetical protein PKA41_08930 [Verrucomicrobiota bacterium]|nr:hypothetical protein [Verrucomicrobiota bacterium]